MISSSTCRYDPLLNMFYVVLERGKSISTGGYGVIYSKPTIIKSSPSYSSISGPKNIIVVKDTYNSKGSTKHLRTDKCKKYLFIEETTYLSERGLLQVFDSGGENIMSTKDLYEKMLDNISFSFPVYITYSYLRSHTFIVIRHNRQKLELLKKIRNIEVHEESNERLWAGKNLQDKIISSSDCKPTLSKYLNSQEQTISRKITLVSEYENKAIREEVTNHMNDFDTTRTRCTLNEVNKVKNKSFELISLRQKLRYCSFYSQIPRMMTDSFTKHKCSYKTNEEDTLFASTNIAFDVYEPDSKHRRNNPGIPDYCVAILPFSIPSPQFEELIKLFGETAGIPLRLAIVADSGTVIVFSIKEFMVPTCAN